MFRRSRVSNERLCWLSAADLGAFWDARLRAVDRLVRNVYAQERARYLADDVLEVLVVCALLGSSLTSRPDDFSYWRSVWSNLMSRRCLVSDLVLFPGLIAVDNASKAVSCSALGLSRAALVDSSLSRYFEPQVLARILAGPSRRAQDPLVLDISVAAPPQAAQMPDVTAASGQYEVPVPTERELQQLGIEQAGYPEILHVYNILLSITDDNLDTVAERILDIYCREIYQGLKTLDDNRPPGAKYMYPQAHSEVGGLGLFSDPNGHRRIFKVMLHAAAICY